MVHLDTITLERLVAAMKTDRVMPSPMGAYLNDNGNYQMTFNILCELMNDGKLRKSRRGRVFEDVHALYKDGHENGFKLLNRQELSIKRILDWMDEESIGDEDEGIAKLFEMLYDFENKNDDSSESCESDESWSGSEEEEGEAKEEDDEDDDEDERAVVLAALDHLIDILVPWVSKNIVNKKSNVTKRSRN